MVNVSNIGNLDGYHEGTERDNGLLKTLGEVFLSKEKCSMKSEVSDDVCVLPIQDTVQLDFSCTFPLAFSISESIVWKISATDWKQKNKFYHIEFRLLGQNGEYEKFIKKAH